VIAGLWTQKETFDGTYSFEDLLDIHELLDIQIVNDRRQREWDEAQNRSRGND
jgi:hypothetical protein